MGGAPCLSDQAIHVHSRAYLGRLFGDTPMSHKRLLEPSSSQSRDASTEVDAQSDGDREEKTNQTSILRRAWTHRLKPNKKWMIHKALDGLGFTRACLAPYFDGTYIKQAGRGESVWVFGRPPFVFSRA